jgi:hypothetical protein
MPRTWNTRPSAWLARGVAPLTGTPAAMPGAKAERPLFIAGEVLQMVVTDAATLGPLRFVNGDELLAFHNRTSRVARNPPSQR